MPGVTCLICMRASILSVTCPVCMLASIRGVTWPVEDSGNFQTET